VPNEETTSRETFVRACETRVEAESIVQQLQKLGFEAENISIIERKFLVIAQGSPEEMSKARDILGSMDVEAARSAAESGSAPITEDDA
jgi:hypothetical protein